ncbi:MAG: gamma-glutamyl-gamma-aminobutyrate hydrolase family protein [Tepidisphaeraceae bacterium]
MAARRPVIGITVDHNSRALPDGTVEYSQYMLPHTYALAVERAGGLPLMLPYRSDAPELVVQYADLCDGFVFSGGNDYDPAAFGEVRHPKAVGVDPNRETFERKLIAEVEKRRKPVLGICGGLQVINLHRGGSLHQFLPDLGLSPTIEHRRASLEEWAKRHGVVLERESFIAQLTGQTEFQSNTSHKQAVNKPGRGLRIVGRAPDGVVEAVEDTSFPFFVAVQWHPERQPGETPHVRLFEGLVGACKRA